MAGAATTGEDYANGREYEGSLGHRLSAVSCFAS
jgi:hypothetical protein